jgi:ribosomal protein S12 methylthiotransferase accessory factor
MLSFEYINNSIEAIKSNLREDEYREFQSTLKLFNHITGPLTELVIHIPEFFEPPFLSATLDHYRIERIISPSWIRESTSANLRVPAGGKGSELFSSINGALGEAIERLLSIIYYVDGREKIVYSTYKKLEKSGIRALGPKDLPLFAEWQYSEPNFIFEQFNENSLVGWIEGQYLKSGQRVFVPAQLVMLYYKPTQKEHKIGYPTTGGLSFRANKKEAITHGILEYIERDAINVRWCCNLPFPRIKIDIDDEAEYITQLKHLEQKLKIDIVYSSIDIKEVAVVAAFAFNENKDAYAFISGANAALNVQDAITGALGEVGQTCKSLRYVELSGTHDITTESTWKDLTEFFDAVVYYGYRDNLSKLKNRLKTQETINLKLLSSKKHTDPNNEYRNMLDILNSYAIDPIIFDFTPSTLPDYPILKVLMPQLTQAFVPSYPYLGHPRYYEIPRKLGRTKKKLQSSDLSREPQPLP